jgi:hypothetical protein
MRSAKALLLECLLLIGAPGHAMERSIGGHAKIRADAAWHRGSDAMAEAGPARGFDPNADLRLKGELRAGPWEFSAHYEVLAVAGDSLAARRRLAAAGVIADPTGLPDDKTRLLRLTRAVFDKDRASCVQRLDRLHAGMGRGPWTLRAGRQAVSWGNGLAFQTLDLLNPFSPGAVDKEYKTGDDVLFGQALTGGWGDAQALAAGRRDPRTGKAAGDASTFAAKQHARFWGTDFDFAAARHYGGAWAGAGAVRSVAGAVVRIDASVAGPGAAFSALANADYSWTAFGKNAYGFAEYFHSGFGEGSREGYAAPSPELRARIERGDLFTLARDYSALGAGLEWTPLLNLRALWIENLDDLSAFLQIYGTYDLSRASTLMAGLNLSLGPRGTEFGGIPLPGGAYLAPGQTMFVRIAGYF